MRRDEDYTAFISVALVLTVVVLIIFQVYINREPARIEEQSAADHAETVEAGLELYAENCTACHGENGEGVNGPPLNSRQLLTLVSDELLISLTRTGIPNTGMPAWGQLFGGPFTDEEIGQLVTFMREWEATAPEIIVEVPVPDAGRGAAIYAHTCSICHGDGGAGTELAPALNDPRRLGRLEDSWYRNTIARGRPARGMPTWGTVLSPAQVDDLVALIGAWRAGETIADDTPFAVHISNALYAVQDFDPEDAAYYLSAALPLADTEQQGQITEILAMVESNQLFDAQTRIAALLPPEEMGLALYTTQCASCHGDDGTGGTGPNLHNSGFIEARDDAALVSFLLAGRPNTSMNGFDGILLEDELNNLVLMLRTWQK